MENFFQKYKNIALFLGIFVVLALGYWFFFGRSEEPTLASSNAVAGSSASRQSVVGQELLTLLLDLRAIHLDETLFADPAFQSLEDFGQELIPEAPGRRNPFAPIGNEPIENTSVENQ